MKQCRMTKQKKLILDMMESRKDHPTADQIYIEARLIDGRISRGTVYRVLEQLAQSGMLLRIKVPGADRYDSRLDYHYHMTCSSCGAVSDAPLDYKKDFDVMVDDKTDFLIQRHRMVFEGLCPSCQKAAERQSKIQ